MGHKTSYLSDHKSEDTEKKTQAQKDDARLPEAMEQSKSLASRYDETDERPAIEQTFQQKEVQVSHHDGKNFIIDKDFEQKMHAREAAEREEREQKRKKQALAEKELANAKAAKVAEEIKKPQSLDPEIIKEKHIAEKSEENLQKLYPDPIPEQSDVEEELWQRRKDKGAQIAGRAKLEDVYDSELHSGILKSFGFQIIGLGLLVLPSLEDTFFPWYIKLLFYAGVAVACFYSYYILKQASKRYLNKKLPSDQENAFTLATILPFMALRIAIASIFTSVPFLGGILGTVICIFIGSGLHYSFLAKYHIPASKEIVALNVLAYVFILLIPSLISFITSPSGGVTEMLIIFSWAAQIAIFFAGDRFAAKMTLGKFNE